MKLKWKDDGTFKSALSRARGLGAAHDGVTHWWHQRVTAAAALPLMLWLAWAAATMPDWSYETFTGWLATPFHAIAVILAVVATFYHAALGTQVIVEDYFHTAWMKIGKLIGIRLFFTATAVACIFAVLKIALAG